jgi:hypothetical protein
MPKVHTVQKAAKDYPGIKKGDKYYWWKFRFGSKQMSKTYPKRSQLTQSSFLQTLYTLQDEFIFDDEDPGSSRDELINEIENLRDECQYSLSNMPEHLQETSDSGLMLQERIEALEAWASELEQVDCDIDDDLEEEEREERVEAIIAELQACECAL